MKAFSVAIALAVSLAATLCTPAAPPPGDALSQQVSGLLAAVQGKRVALLTNPTGVDGQLTQIADILFNDSGTTLVEFFAPEHGLRGDIQAGGNVTDYTDPYTSLPVYAVYGVRNAPTDAMLAGVDALVCDLQDVGSRFYTYAWTMTYSMEAAARNSVEFLVFDRPNPIGCDRVEGAPNSQDAGLVGRVWPGQPFGVATRHGMTIGEIANLVNNEWMSPKVPLQVITIPGYQRSVWFEQTGRQWILPSPNMPTVDTATVYPGMCVFEGTNISEGRGTTKPFEIIGAPFINGIALANTMNAMNMPGVRFRPAFFKPTFSKFVNQQCNGVQVHVMDRATFDPIRTALTLLKTIRDTYPSQVTIGSYSATLMGVPNLGSRLATESVDSIVSGWQADLDAFKVIRARNLLYPAGAGVPEWRQQR
jgi:uncharacterized protein YbbC (DUF1343 family)